MSLTYKTKTATAGEVLGHLAECDDDFVPPLSSRVDLGEYARKIHDLAVTFEAWDGDKLAGLLAAYFNDAKNRRGYITNVSLVREYSGQGIAARLLEMSLGYARELKYKEIELEVNEANSRAVHLYRKHGFETVKEGVEILMKLELGRQ
jgi:ribosomal protein S18 acetylase RimI-like enzyme